MTVPVAPVPQLSDLFTLLMQTPEMIQQQPHLALTADGRTALHLALQLLLKKEDGLPKECVVNLDVINTIRKEWLTEFVATLRDEKLKAVENALKFALDLE